MSDAETMVDGSKNFFIWSKRSCAATVSVPLFVCIATVLHLCSVCARHSSSVIRTRVARWPHAKLSYPNDNRPYFPTSSSVINNNTTRTPHPNNYLNTRLLP